MTGYKPNGPQRDFQGWTRPSKPTWNVRLKQFVLKAWRSRGKIVEALWNRTSSLIFPFWNRKTRAEALRRKKICGTCAFNSTNYKRLDPDASSREVLPYCTLCTCIIDLKVYCMSCNCGIEELHKESSTSTIPLKWKALV